MLGDFLTIHQCFNKEVSDSVCSNTAGSRSRDKCEPLHPLLVLGLLLLLPPLVQQLYYAEVSYNNNPEDECDA